MKDPARLVAAYDDSAGVTAEFNRNVLHVINQGLGANFEPDQFEHVALWNEVDQRIEMRLSARLPMKVSIPAIDLMVSFEEGEQMRTEVSTKFRQTGTRPGASRRRSRAGAVVPRSGRRLRTGDGDPQADDYGDAMVNNEATPALKVPESQYVDVDGAPVHWVDFGGPEQAPLAVCVHGLGGSWVNWLAFAPLLNGPLPGDRLRSGWQRPHSRRRAAGRHP